MAANNAADAVAALELCCLRALLGDAWGLALARAFAQPDAPLRAPGYHSRHMVCHAAGAAPVDDVATLALRLAAPAEDNGAPLWWEVNPAACTELAAAHEGMAAAYIRSLVSVLEASEAGAHTAGEVSLRGEALRRLASLALRSAALREAVLDGAGGTLRSARGAGPQQVLKLLQKLGEE